VKGDIHNLGKDIVAMLFKISGYEVRDLGVDVANSKFLEEAEKHQADIMALSSLLTSTMPIQKDLIKILKEKGIRDRYKVIIGGGPVTEEWAENIGADGYAENAMEALTLVNNLMEEKPC
jgi:methylmalonyl-CoA mutase cobalamin-binding domain/chain